jgi:pre-mRNA-splicing factor 38A
MANVTDPLAGAVHGTDPQNLMEYITRQRIYDCRYWKEECFGLTAADVLEKATHLKCYRSIVWREFSPYQVPMFGSEVAADSTTSRTN